MVRSFPPVKGYKRVIRFKAIRTADGGLRTAGPVRRMYRKIKAVVKKAVIKNQEVKHIGQNVVNDRFNSTISGASECYSILPAVAEGTAGHNRVGDRIRPKYLIVKGKLMYDTALAGTYLPPSTVRVMILTQKNLRVGSQISTLVDTDHLLKDNIGTDVARAYTGSNFDNLAPINKDLFSVLMDRKFKMRAQIEKQLGDNNTVLGYATQQTITFYKKIKCPAQLCFDDGNGNQANNFAPFVCLGSVVDDNSGAWTASSPYRLVVQSELYFTDA